ncbi:MAG: hypothetical protein KC462_03760, partial [Cyanobacteria bacterium HKST-UBA05]|nr:hypothetical protein [Cyanobacteria bacterium HKST-UBA05]
YPYAPPSPYVVTPTAYPASAYAYTYAAVQPTATPPTPAPWRWSQPQPQFQPQPTDQFTPIASSYTPGQGSQGLSTSSTSSTASTASTATPPVTILDEPQPDPTVASKTTEPGGDSSSNALYKAFNDNRASSLTHTQRLEVATDELLQLAQDTRDDKHGLLHRLRDMGITVLKADKHPWVTPILEAHNADSHSLLWFPPSFFYAEAPPFQAQAAVEPEWTKAQETASQNKQPMLLVDQSQASIGQLLKQAFVALQIKNGLPAAGDDYHHTNQALEALNTLETQNGWFKMLYKHAIKAPWWRMKTAMGWHKPALSGPGHALRLMMQRYDDTARVMLTNRNKLTLTPTDIKALRKQQSRARFVTALSYSLD